MAEKRQISKSEKLNTNQSRQTAFVAKQSTDLKALEQSIKNNPADLESAMKLAEQYYLTNQETKILDVLRPIDVSAFPPGSPIKFRHCTLTAIGQAFMGQLNESEQTCEQGLKEFPDALDFYYLLTYLKILLREYNAAIECGEKYLSLLKNKPVLEGMPLPLCGKKAHLSQIENMLGNAYREQKDTVKAIAHYNTAIETDPKNRLPYLNLATTYSHKHEIEKARLVLEKGINKCSQIEDLLILKGSLANQRTVSACMIVKDEEKLLPGCLKSIRNWVDEIIVVDTGSKDKTVEIAESYGAKVFQQEWEGDFSKHRNYSLEQAKSEWIFIIDADERISDEDVPRLRELINSGRHSIISINVFNVYGKEQDTTTILPSVRLFKRELNLRYRGIVYNRLNVPVDAAVVRANVKFMHLGYDLDPDQIKKKFERSRALLLKQLEKDPDDAFSLFNLAQLLRAAGRDNPAQVSDKIIEYATRAVKLTKPNERITRSIHLMALDRLAWAYFYKKDYGQALEFAHRAIGNKQDYLNPLLLLGHIHTQQQDFEKARDYYLRYIEVQKNYDPSSEIDNLILFSPDSRATACYGLGMLYDIQNQKDEALKYYQKTALIKSDYLDVQNRIKILTSNSSKNESGLTRVEQLLDEHNFEEVEQICQKLIDDSPNKNAVSESIAMLFFKRGHYREATKYYWQLLDANPNDPKILNDLANCHFKMNEYEKALEYYESASELPDAPAILFRNLGITCSILKLFGSAIVAFRKYIAEHPEDGEIITIMADLYSKTGDFNSALPLYEKSLRANPNDYAAVFSLSECYLNLGHEESAKRGYNRTLELKPDYEPARKRLIQLEEVTSDY